MQTAVSQKNIAETWQGSRSSLFSKALLIVGLLAVAIGSVGIGIAQDPSWLRFFDNLHWTVSTTVAAILVWLHQPNDKDSAHFGSRWIAYGLIAYALGQCLWDIQVAWGYSHFPAPADLFYLLLGPCIFTAQVLQIKKATSGHQRKLAWIDSSLLTVALWTLILALYIPKRGDTNLLALITLVAYPATLFAALGITLIMIPTLRLRLNAGLLFFTTGLAFTGFSWMQWNTMALDGTTIDGAWFNPSFSVAVLMLGYGLTQWRLEKSTDPRWDRQCEGVLRQLPIAAVISASLTITASHTLELLAPVALFIADLGCALVIILAVIRQGAMLKERDQLLGTQNALLTSQRALAQERSLLKSLIGAIPDLVWLKDTNGRYLSCNPMFAKHLGISEKDISGKTDYDFVDHPLADIYHQNDQLAISESAMNPINEVWLTFVDGGYRGLFETTKTPAYDRDGNLIGVLGIARDITGRHLSQEQDRIAAAAFESMDGMMITDANKTILKVNRAFTDSTGYTAEEAVGQSPRLLSSGRHDRDFYRSMWNDVRVTGGWQGEVWDRRKNGEIYPKWLTIKAVKDVAGSVTHYIGSHHDISEQKRAAGRINELAFYDQLTGLPNRTLLLDRLEQRVAISTRDRDLHALLFIDLDAFKTVNDTLGHGTGDLLLQQVGVRLKSSIRDGDTVARLGGDEFVVLMSGLGTDSEMAVAHAESIAEKIRQSLSEPYQLNDVTRYSSASIGVTLFGNLGTDTQELLKQADLAMYKAKSAGRNAVRFFDPAMQADVMRRAQMEADLRQAVSESQFLLHYQAQVTQLGKVTGAEVLVRWAHPVRGMVSPGEFIPLAEETGIIKTIGHWVLETACRQLADWAKQGDMAALTIAVNVSAQQFREPDFVEQVLEILRETGADSKLLKLELTESLLVSDVDEVIRKMLALKEKGVGFSLDDFGTGFSSLTYLKRLPLDQLKIDQSFVRDLLIDPNDAAFVKTIISLAKSLGLAVIAEGVETAEQRDFLAQADCPTFQGYFFHRPSPVAQFEALVKNLPHQP